MNIAVCPSCDVLVDVDQAPKEWNHNCYKCGRRLDRHSVEKRLRESFEKYLRDEKEWRVEF